MGRNGVRKEWKHVWTRAEVHEKWVERWREPVAHLVQVVISYQRIVVVETHLQQVHHVSLIQHPVL